MASIVNICFASKSKYLALKCDTNCQKPPHAQIYTAHSMATSILTSMFIGVSKENIALGSKSSKSCIADETSKADQIFQKKMKSFKVD